MKTNPRLEEAIDKILSSLEGIERAKPSPFFLTRVQARLSHRAAPKVGITWAFRPAWVAATLGLVLLLNVSAVVYVRERLAQREQEQDIIGFFGDDERESNALDW